MDDDEFLAHVADRLAGLPAVRAVTLGGSRAEGTHRPDSDWDFSVYYRGHFDPQALRDIGWPGEVFEIGGWSPGVFNGGAWLEIDGRRTDVHYRDLDTIDREIEASREGRFDIEPLMFHLAGIPSYLVLAELAVKRVLHGELPTPDYPVALRTRASRVWWDRACRTFDYARRNHAPYGRVTQCAGLAAQATSQAAHAVLAGRGKWITNEKQLLTKAGLREVDAYFAAAGTEPDALRDVVDRSHDACANAMRQAERVEERDRPLSLRLEGLAQLLEGRFIDLLPELQAISARVCTAFSHEHPGQLAWSSIYEGREAPAIAFGDEAYGFLESPDTLEVGGDVDRIPEVIGWARAKSTAFAVMAAEGPAVDRLAGLGGTVVKDAPWFVQQTLDLRKLSVPEIPGYHFRHVDPAEVAARAECHRAAWSDDKPSSMTDQMYGWLMETPYYDLALDWVAVAAHTGEMVASCTVWRCGDIALVEPVGCAPQHRRRGLGAAVTLAALAAAREQGATVGVVRPRGDGAYPVPLLVYRSIGFIDRLRIREVRFE